MSDKVSPLWRVILEESVWGRRGMVKSNSMWLPLTLVVSIHGPYQVQFGAPFVCGVFCAIVCWSTASILMNDLADRHIDHLAGKSRWISRLSPKWATCVVGLLFLAGVTFILVTPGLAGAIWVFLGAFACSILYSTKPVQTKNRGVLGLATYALACTLAYALIPWCAGRSDPVLLLVLSLAVMLNKWVNLHFHQILDFDADRSGNVKTFAVVVGRKKARSILKGFEGIAIASFLSVLTYVIIRFRSLTAAVVVCAVAIGLACAGFVHMRGKTTALLSILSWPYLALSFTLFSFLPLLLLFRLSLLDSSVWWIFIAAAILLVSEAIYVVGYRYD